MAKYSLYKVHVVVNVNGDIVGTVVTDDGIATVYINDKSYTLAVEKRPINHRRFSVRPRVR